MKISKLIALSLTVASTQALAFQAKDAPDTGLSGHQLNLVENTILSNLYSQHGATYQTRLTGTCAAVPIPNCNCPFCSMLRSQKA
ncbi:hypothetical protein SAMN05192562_102428 [Kosakonia arachidis]|uniref:Uncharacterized protein n=1 Tax=Kosakonia arachidis TaxID=551989 RepID=A0A1I7BAJ2_9ENTR|nr:hypothetical protein [Kosakonia arachidis]SFT84245.1 hypothetical protein SAMN05192562_102428 [Kosakonia arachidis]